MINTDDTQDPARPLSAVPQRSSEGFNVRYAWVAVLLVTAVVILFDLFSHGHPGGVHWESIPLFFWGCGFLSCLILLLTAKWVGLLLGRREDDDE